MSSKSAFTLVEMLVVIAIIVVLMALLLPAVQASREAMRRAQCGNNLRQYGIALTSYEGTWHMLPPGGVDNFGSPQIGWQVRILPQMDQGTIFEKIDMKAAAAWDTLIPTSDSPNRRAREIQVPYARCPTDSSDQYTKNGWAQASYSGSLGSQRTPSFDGNCNDFLGPGLNYDSIRGIADHGNSTSRGAISGAFNRMGAIIRFQDFKDGVSQTFLMGEILPDCNDHFQGWWHYNGMANAHASTSVPLNNMNTCWDGLRITKPNCTAQSNWNYSWGFRSQHLGGANFLLGDGAVVFIKESIDYQTYQRLGGRSDGTVLNDSDFRGN